MQGNKIAPEKISDMREYRKDHTRKETMAKFGVSEATVSRKCKGVESSAKVEAKVNKEFKFPFQPIVGKCVELKFRELSEEDQKKYNDCKPAVKEKTRTYAGY